MSRHILLIGATGVFGRKLAAHLATLPDVRLTLTSRTLARAQTLTADLVSRSTTLAPCNAAALDTRADISGQISAIAPWLVIDASGPFQGANYDCAGAALRAGAHTIDLADARTYLSGFAVALNDLARSKGLVALAGASSTPALSSAVVARLTTGWLRVDTIDIAITPGGRSDVGQAVIAASLSYAGRPVPVFNDGALAQAAGWTGSIVTSVPGLGRRRLALVETADAEALSARFGVQSRVTFRAGLDSSIEQFGIMGLAHLRRLGVVGSLSGLAPLLLAARRITRLPTGDRGGMQVAVSGLDAEGRFATATWRLLATNGHGPQVPTLPAAAAVRALLNGALEAGARPCIDVLDLVSIEAEMRAYAITTSVDVQLSDGGNVFSGAAGPGAYGDLPAAVRAFHACDAPSVWRGTADIVASPGIVAALVRCCIGLPSANGQVPVAVTVDRGFEPAASRPGIEGRKERRWTETWHRNFGGQRFTSQLLAGEPGVVVERFGPLRFRLKPTLSPAGITMPVRGWSIWHVPLPGWLAPSSDARETMDDQGRFRFDVQLSLPLVGTVAHYCGWLVPAVAAAATPRTGSEKVAGPNA